MIPRKPSSALHHKWGQPRLKEAFIQLLIHKSRVGGSNTGGFRAKKLPPSSPGIMGQQRNSEIVTHLERLADGLSQEAGRFRRLANHALDLERKRNFHEQSFELRMRAESIRRGMSESSKAF